MRITVLANKDLASCLALNYLLPQLGKHILNVFLSSAVGGAKNASTEPRQLREFRFMEQQLFNDMLFPLMDANPALFAVSELQTFSSLAQYTEQPFSELNNINEDEGFARLAASKPDLILSIRYGWILKEKVIALPEHGILNLHSGKLPDYRGVMASFWALLHNEKSLGTTLHFIDDPGIDTGPVVGRSELNTDSEKSYLWHVLELYREGCKLMQLAVESIAKDIELKTEPQPNSGNYFTFPNNEELGIFEEKGLCLFTSDDIMEIFKRFLN